MDRVKFTVKWAPRDQRKLKIVHPSDSEIAEKFDDWKIGWGWLGNRS